jgi:hypothetical protein
MFSGWDTWEAKADSSVPVGEPYDKNRRKKNNDMIRRHRLEERGYRLGKCNSTLGKD